MIVWLRKVRLFRRVLLLAVSSISLHSKIGFRKSVWATGELQTCVNTNNPELLNFKLVGDCTGGVSLSFNQK